MGLWALREASRPTPQRGPRRGEDAEAVAEWERESGAQEGSDAGSASAFTPDSGPGTWGREGLSYTAIATREPGFPALRRGPAEEAGGYLRGCAFVPEEKFVLEAWRRQR